MRNLPLARLSVCTNRSLRWLLNDNDHYHYILLYGHEHDLVDANDRDKLNRNYVDSYFHVITYIYSYRAKCY